MGWVILILTIVYLFYRAKPSSTTQFVASRPAVSSPRRKKLSSKADFEQEVNRLISVMICHRCNTGEIPTYSKKNGMEIINCCCDSFLAEIMARIEEHFSTDSVECIMACKANLSVRLCKDPTPSLHSKKLFPGEPEIQITYVDSQNQETIRTISNLRYSKSYFFKAYCHLREDERHFCPERIKEAIDLKTGEVLDTITVTWGNKGKNRHFKDIGWK